mmetsp:Transcript_22228/g.53229  ORF Transcript_22228/g.53229 Transcript_22228/m.53229 type:complete len:222 (+) Transcript_22228:504-1169(+)
MRGLGLEGRCRRVRAPNHHIGRVSFLGGRVSRGTRARRLQIVIRGIEHGLAVSGPPRRAGRAGALCEVVVEEVVVVEAGVLQVSTGRRGVGGVDMRGGMAVSNEGDLGPVPTAISPGARGVGAARGVDGARHGAGAALALQFLGRVRAGPVKSRSVDNAPAAVFVAVANASGLGIACSLARGLREALRIPAVHLIRRATVSTAPTGAKVGVRCRVDRRVHV